MQEKISKEEILLHTFREDETIVCSAQWLQKELRMAQKLTNELKGKDLRIEKLLTKIDGLEARIEITELYNSRAKYILDEMG